MLVLPLKSYTRTPRSGQLGDGGGAATALEAKYRLYGESRMQELHDQLANLQVTEAEQYE